MIEQRAPAKSVIVARALPPGPSSSFITTEVFKCVIQVSRCPRRVKSFDLNVVSIQQLPGRPNSATRSGANFRIADNAVGVRLEWNFFAEVVSGKVFCTIERMLASHAEVRMSLEGDVPKKDATVVIGKQIFALVPSLLANDAEKLKVQS